MYRFTTVRYLPDSTTIFVRKECKFKVQRVMQLVCVSSCYHNGVFRSVRGQLGYSHSLLPVKSILLLKNHHQKYKYNYQYYFPKTRTNCMTHCSHQKLYEKNYINRSNYRTFGILGVSTSATQASARTQSPLQIFDTHSYKYKGGMSALCSEQNTAIIAHK